MHNVFLLTGSNLGDRQLFLKRAINCIEQDVATVLKVSSVYETQSWGKSDAPDYLNQVIWLQTDLTAKAVLQQILNIEKQLGRERAEKWGPRTIDIDILFYDQAIIDEEGLQIPHPELHKRMFTLAPLAEIAPEFIHPVLNESILNIKNKLKDSLIVKKL